MKIMLDSPIYDQAGHAEIEVRDEVGGLYDRTRRSTVTQTLDGGVVVEDMGFTHGDRKLVIMVSNLPKETGDIVRTLFETYSELIVSTSDGVFSSSPVSYTRQRGQDIITLQLVSKISEE